MVSQIVGAWNDASGSPIIFTFATGSTPHGFELRTLLLWGLFLSETDGQNLLTSKALNLRGGGAVD
jgi:hypothetical protein